MKVVFLINYLITKIVGLSCKDFCFVGDKFKNMAHVVLRFARKRVW